MKKLNLLNNTLNSINRQILENKFSFKVSFFSHYIFKSMGLKNPFKFPKSRFKFQNIILNTRENTIDFWACLESYEPDLTYFLMNVLKDKKGTFIDVGGHIGRFTVLMAKNEWEVITFEPMKSNYQMILKNLEENKCTQNANVFNLGLGNVSEKKTIFYNSEEMGESSLVMSNDKKNKDTIEIVTFDEFIKDRKFNELCITKVDIEGNEENAIKGMLNFIKNEKPILILELWKDNEEGMTNILKSLGYKRLHIFWFIEEKHKTYMDKMYELYSKYSVQYEYQ